MSRTLSLLLPVHNAQAYLEPTVLALLDVVPELTPNFEVLIIDDGSSDDTSDTAQQLVARFPQIQLIRNSHRLGMAGAIGCGVAAARGEVILLREDGTKLELAHLGRLWRRMGRRHFIQVRDSAARQPAAIAAARPVAITSWERAVARTGQAGAAPDPAKISPPGFKMFLRSIARDLPWSITDAEAFVAELTARGYDCEDIRLGQEPAASAPAASPGATNRPKPRRPNYLARILALTSGN